MIQININDIAVKVRAAVLTGLSFAVSTAITATDTVLEALGKLQSQIDLKADDSDVVKLTGNQTVAGEKTFTDQTGVDVLEFSGTESLIVTPGVDKSRMYEKKYIDAGYKILELVSKDELGIETVIRSNKIEI